MSIERVWICIHLGHLIGRDVKVDGIKNAVSDLYHRTNDMDVNFSKDNPLVQYALFKSRCMALYGCPLWDLSAKSVNLVPTVWHK